ncbi:uncharacterized protein LOC135952644 [Calliphora vicina]|uniref:uncharacterized protein LOC135952644 n=1 Tax=Calliphora vicina TaxID=7373 RepID=UPI00325AC538
MQKLALYRILVLLMAALDLGQTFVLKQEQEFAIEGRTKFDDDLREVVEFLKLQMQCGYPKAGVPALAPYRSDFVEYDFEKSTWSLKGNFSNLVITGLNEFDVVVLHWNNILRKITFELNFPELEARSSYKLNSISQMFAEPAYFFGNGLFRLDLLNLRAKGSFKLKPLLLSGGLAVVDFKTQLQLESSRSRSTGFMNSLLYTKLFNSWIEEFIKVTFSEQKEVSNAVEHLVVPVMDKALKNISLVELVALITGLAEVGVPTEAIC